PTSFPLSSKSALRSPTTPTPLRSVNKPHVLLASRLSLSPPCGKCLEIFLEPPLSLVTPRSHRFPGQACPVCRTIPTRPELSTTAGQRSLNDHKDPDAFIRRPRLHFTFYVLRFTHHASRSTLHALRHRADHRHDFHLRLDHPRRRVRLFDEG